MLIKFVADCLIYKKSLVSDLLVFKVADPFELFSEPNLNIKNLFFTKIANDSIFLYFRHRHVLV